MRFHSIIVIGCCFLFACTSTSESEAQVKNSDLISVESNEEQGLVLNDGEKWEMPYEMMWLIQQQKDKLFEYTMAKDTTYLEFGNQLDSLCQSLVQVCSMTGEGHDNLHLWLIPYWEKIDAILVAANHQEAQLLIDQLNDDFIEFDNYFE